MNYKNYYYLLILLFLGISTTSFSQKQNTSQPYWPAITQEAKPWTRWWWMGSAVDAGNIKRLITDYAEHGIGGVEITPIYGVKGEEANHIDFLSPGWIKMLAVTADVAKQNGMGVDMNTGTGWPFGGPQVTGAFAAKKMEFQQLGDLSQGQVEQFIRKMKDSAAVDLIALSASNKLGERINLLENGASVDQIRDSGRGVTGITQSNTGQKVKRAAPGGEGLVFNHFSKAATEHYLERFDQAFNGNPGVRCFFNDSYELEAASAASELFATFKKRKGYDLALYAQELSGAGNPDIIARIKADYRDVLGQMLLENFTNTWTQWAESYGSVTRNQAHGSPGNLIDLYAAVGIPELETFDATHFPFLQTFIDSSGAKHTESNKLFKKFASSAAHMKGEPLVSCETFTWLNEHFNTPLYQCKPELDELFVKGVNHLFFHGTAYSPERAGWPGWCFYASVHIDPNNPQWDDMEAMNAYIARCQSVLQQGQHTNDFLVFWSPDDYNHDAASLDKKLTLHNSESWVNMPEIEALLDKGYLFDFTTDRIVRNAGVEGNNVLTFGKVPYNAIVVPEMKHIKTETFEKLFALAESGATVIFERFPETVSGFKNYKEEAGRMAELIASLKFEKQGDCQVATKGRGFIYLGDVERALNLAGISREKLIDKHIKSISRKTGFGYYYFIANHESTDVDDWLEFKYYAKNALIMNPMNGDVRMAESDGNKVKIRLESGESRIVCFTNEPVGDVAGDVSYAQGKELLPEAKWTLKAVKGGPTLFEATELTGPKFWTDLQGEVYSDFSGTAEYAATLKLNPKKADDYLLKFDRVEASVRVFINDQQVGTLWSFPYEIKIGPYLKEGKNTLRFEVSNLGANRVRYMDRHGIVWKKFENINIVNLDYRPLDASNWSVLPSGINGPVKIIELYKK
jgi:hypothetical protein